MAEQPTIYGRLVAVVLAGDQERASRAAKALAALTDRERSIVEAAAIAGHRSGVLDVRNGIPPDSEITAMVVAASPTIPTDRTPREQHLLHDAAVMGFVRGKRNGSNLDDEAAVEHVVAHCQSMSDLYPVLGGSIQEMAMRIIRKRQPVQPWALVEVVAELCAFDRETVSTMLADLVSDGTLTDTPDGLRLNDNTPTDPE